MDKKAAAAEIKRLRKQAENESIPQEARSEMLDRANAIEYEFYEKEAGMAKGGAMKKKYAKGGAAKKDKEEGMLSKIGGLYMEGAKMVAQDINRVLGTKAGKELDKQKGRIDGYAKGGAVKKPATKKTAGRQSPVVAVMIGMTEKKPAAKKTTKMAKGGYANCGASVKAAGGK